jgi:hypothetical protein
MADLDCGLNMLFEKRDLKFETINLLNFYQAEPIFLSKEH